MFAQAPSRASSLGWSSPLMAAAAALGLGLLVGAAAVLASPLAALAALLGGATLLALLRKPELGLYALVAIAFLLPFAVIPLRLGAQLTALEAVLGLTLGATLLRALARRERLSPEPVVWLLIGVLALATVSFVLSLPYAGGITEVGRPFVKLVLAMLVFPMVLRLIQNCRQIDGLLLTIMLCAGLEAVVSVFLYWAPRETSVQLLSSLGPLGYPTGPDVLRFLPGENDTYTDIARATGTSIDPNVLGGELMLAAALLLAQLFSARPLLSRWTLLILSTFAIFGMLLSHSRSSWVGLAIAVLGLATLRYRLVWLAIVPAAIAVALVPAGRALYARVVAGFAGQDKAAAMRLDEYRNALEIVLQYPLLGIGFGGPPAIDLAPGVSSIYLAVAETMGLPALALFLTLLVWLIGRAAGPLIHAPDPHLQSRLASLLTVLAAALAGGLFDHYFASTAFPHMVALFWLCCGLLWRSTPAGSACGGYEGAKSRDLSLRALGDDSSTRSE